MYDASLNLHHHGKKPGYFPWHPIDVCAGGDGKEKIELDQQKLGEGVGS